jgi:hypothetical protein
MINPKRRQSGMIWTRLFALAVLLAAALSPASAAMRFDDLPERVRTDLFTLAQACSIIGGRPGDSMEAIAFFDLDENGELDIILDEGRFPCAGVRPDAHCREVGCSTYVTLSMRGSWRPAFDVVGSYCIDRTDDPPRFVTIQRNYHVDGTITVLNVRYRFRRGMAFQEGRGAC